MPLGGWRWSTDAGFLQVESLRLGSVLRLFAFPLLLVVGFFVFSGALSGPFLLDDQRIYSYGGEVSGEPITHHFSSLAKLREFIDSRPLSMLSFFIEDVGWPSTPYRFKLNNLLLHLVNACLLFLVVYRLFVDSPANRRWLSAFLAAGLWLLHPIQLSTMMTVVQRMTLLMATFVLLGMLVYVWARTGRRGLWQRYTAMTIAVVVMGGLAVLCKPNGGLLVLFILITEATLLSAHPRPVGFRGWSAVFLAMPALIIFAALASQAQASPDLGIAQRLFTEARVLWDYLGKILLPRVTELGLYHDDFLPSSSLFSPPATVFSVVGILLCLAVALWKQRQFPLFAFAVLWFLSGQLFESTVVPLELYFEHRNYVPMIGILVAVAAFLTLTVHARFAYWLGTTILIILAAVSLSYSAVWGNAGIMAATWARNNPESARAHTHLANHLWLAGNHDQALDVLYGSWNRLPDNIYLLAKALELECTLDRPVTIDLQPVIAAATGSRWTQPLAHSLTNVGERIRAGECSVVSAPDLDRLLAAVLLSPAARNRPRFAFYLWMERAFLAEYLGDIHAAWTAASTAHGLWASPYVSLHLSRIALTKGSPQDALRYWLLADRQLEQGGSVDDQLQKLSAAQAERMHATGLIGALQK